ncbi:GH17994 [Drosophila grimshawi]|uniref:GH17994 n=1 Tax=Drosophila grimshawi TaxID=7222 RepID=B4K3U1_DROGR|nr:GH17994 [Drosophila grimshawi]
MHADTTEAWFTGPRPRIDSWESTESVEPDETEESEGETEDRGTLDEEEHMLISSEDEEERRSSTSPAISDDEEAMPWPQETPEPDVITVSDEETMPWPPETPEPEVIVISDEEEEQREDGGEAQRQGERPQIPPPTPQAPTPRSDNGAQHRPP